MIDRVVNMFVNVICQFPSCLWFLLHNHGQDIWDKLWFSVWNSALWEGFKFSKENLVKHRKVSKYYQHDCSLAFSYSMGSAFFFLQDYYDIQNSALFSVSKRSIYFEVNLICPRYSLIATGNFFSNNHPYKMHFRDVFRTLIENACTKP